MAQWKSAFIYCMQITAPDPRRSNRDLEWRASIARERRVRYDVRCFTASPAADALPALLEPRSCVMC
jgi:hypothetical protein